MSEREPRIPGVVVILLLAAILAAVAYFIVANARGGPY
jgi:hypothetical protein